MIKQVIVAQIQLEHCPLWSTFSTGQCSAVKLCKVGDGGVDSDVVSTHICSHNRPTCRQQQLETAFQLQSAVSPLCCLPLPSNFSSNPILIHLFIFIFNFIRIVFVFYFLIPPSKQASNPRTCRVHPPWTFASPSPFHQSGGRWRRRWKRTK